MTSPETNPEIKVLDKGFVRLIDHMGSDLSVVNAARVSFGKRKEAFEEGDAKLIGYLAEHEHTSPFRHTALTLHVKAPIFVFRQWMKHRIGSEFNEISGRYVEFPEDEFFVPETFRKQAKVNKQGSEGEIDAGEPRLGPWRATWRVAGGPWPTTRNCSPWASAESRPAACCPWGSTPRSTGP